MSQLERKMFSRQVAQRTGAPWVKPSVWLSICMLLVTSPMAALAEMSEGPALFAQHCAACHQASGAGAPGLAPPLIGPHWGRLGSQPRYLAQVVLHGLSGPIMIEGQRFVGAMPGFAGSLSDAQLLSLLAHVTALQQRAASPIDPSELARLRSAGGNPASSRALREQLLR